MLGIAVPAARLALVTGVLCGLIYPLAITGIAQLLMPARANGSLVRVADGTILGSRLIGQQWDGPEWFHGRPSAITLTDPADPAKTIAAPYDAASSGGSNLGPTSKALATRLDRDHWSLGADQPELLSQFLPSDMLTASASGLDPDISPANAALQVPRVARARHLTLATVQDLVSRHTSGRALGVFGEPRVNVLELNLALQGAAAGS
ncbi:MAG TPA: potassium-transporting ATPase subunit KdpC [Candidatus Sulfotelmatobacter sp.]|nr:potassium-transporting ATPase subunit KdpC [Candidatus Sulfotelmatobacter sp.]